MSKAALVVARSLGAACAILALAPATMAQSWEDNQQDEYPAQPATEDEANPDDEATAGADEGDSSGGNFNQADRDQDDDEEANDGRDSDEGRSEQRYGGWHRGNELTGSGVRDLYPALRDTPQGHAFVLRRFDLNRDQRIDRGEARQANRAFFHFADRNRDGQLTEREVRFALSERRWGWTGENQDQRWDHQPRYDDR